MASIRHFPATHPLPDWRNLGIALRVLLGINALALLAALVKSPNLRAWPEHYIELAAIVEPLVLISLGLLALLRDFLRRLPLRLGQAGVLALVALTALGLHLAEQPIINMDGTASPLRTMLLAIAAALFLLIYFELRSQAFSPAQAEARLAALNARIRPHFLFNSLNAVLSLIRARPQQAESALESLSDLFRAAMRDPAERVSLADEIALGRQYLELERLRLGERLQVDWQIGDIPAEIAIPPLMLQPLLENAIYHGIEPAPDGGTLRISIARHDDELRLCIENPVNAEFRHVGGKQMALANIRERLALYYDLEARLHIESEENRYEVCIFLPCRQNTR